MDEQSPADRQLSEREQERRRFLENAKNMAVVAPAVALLLAASRKQVMAGNLYGGGGGNLNPAGHLVPGQGQGIIAPNTGPIGPGGGPTSAPGLGGEGQGVGQVGKLK